jgi:two-component system, cell cycle response regulator
MALTAGLSIVPDFERSSVGTVLLIDDDADIRKLVSLWLGKAEIPLIEAVDGASGLLLARAHADNLDAIVLDVMMPGIDGFEVLRQLRLDPTTAPIPVVLLTAHANTEADMLRAAESGAVEHLAKPFSGAILTAKMRLIIQRTRKERELRQKLLFAEEIAAVDPLTKLFNRRHFKRRIVELGAQARRHRQPVSVFIADLDHFKSVNDTYGHPEGDRVLVHVANALRSVMRTEDLAVRFGGEEFVAVLQMCTSVDALVVAKRLREQLRATPVRLGDEDRIIAFSGGIAAADESNDFSMDGIVERADVALYEAKNAGRDRVFLAK